MDKIIEEIKALFKRNGLNCTDENAKEVLNLTLTDHRIARMAILLSTRKEYDLEKN